MNAADGGQDTASLNKATVALAVVRSLAMFHELPTAEQTQIAELTHVVQLARGELLFQRGDRPKGFYVVLSGQVKLALSTPAGMEKIVEILGPRQSFAEALIFLDQPFPVNAQAVTDAVVLAIPREPVLGLIERDQRVARVMLAGLARRLHGLIRDVEDYTLRSGSERVIGYLLRHVEDTASGPAAFTLTSAKGMIASRLNLTPEALSRALHGLAAAGLIAVDGPDIRIHDVEKLRAYSRA